MITCILQTQNKEKRIVDQIHGLEAEYERIVILNRDEQNNKLNQVPNTVAVWGFCSCTDHQFWGFCQWEIRFPLTPVNESRCPLSLTVRRSERKRDLGV